jgi:WD40 repeat protein
MAVLLALFLLALFYVGDSPTVDARIVTFAPPPGYSRSIEAVTFSRDGTRLNVAGQDGALAFWNLARENGEPLPPASREYTYWPSFADDGKSLAAVTKDASVIVMDPYSRARPSILSDLSRNLSSLALSPNGELLAAGDEDGMIELCEVKTGRLLRRFRASATRITCARFSPDGSLLATGGMEGTLTLWDARRGLVKTVMRDDSNLPVSGHLASPVSDVAFSPDGKTLASVQYDDCHVRLWGVASGRYRTTLCGASHIIMTVAFSPDGRLIASGETDGTVILWNARTFQQRCTLRGHSSQVSTLAFSPDGRTLASGDADAVVRVWDLESSPSSPDDWGSSS